ncbi:hypothetical protein J0H58_21745 [bacterium]|nr:hypothetical protein [bacterium]
MSRRNRPSSEEGSPLYERVVGELMARCRAADYLRWADLCRFIEEVFVTRLGRFPTGQQFASIEREVDARRHEESIVWPRPPLPIWPLEGFVVKDTRWDGSSYMLVVWLNGHGPEPFELQVPLGAGTPYFIRDDISGWQANAIRALEGD